MPVPVPTEVCQLSSQDARKFIVLEDAAAAAYRNTGGSELALDEGIGIELPSPGADTETAEVHSTVLLRVPPASCSIAIRNAGMPRHHRTG